MFQAGNSGIGNHDRTAIQLTAVFLKEAGKTFAADLLLTFQHKSLIAGQRGASLQIGFDSFKMGKILSLVIGATAGVNNPTIDAGLKRGRIP